MFPFAGFNNRGFEKIVSNKTKIKKSNKNRFSCEWQNTGEEKSLHPN